MQPGRGPALPTATVAAALLIASGQLNRKLACDHCEIPEGGARSRVGTLAKQIEWWCDGCMPTLPDEYSQPPAPAAAVPAKPAKPKRKIDEIMMLPQYTEMLDEHYQRDCVKDSSALSPQQTRRIHSLQANSPGGGCTISTYAADATPFDESKTARTRRLGTNRERRRQALKTLEVRICARHDPVVGEKAGRRKEMATLPRERQEWLAKELRNTPRLLDYNPLLLFELGQIKENPGTWTCALDGSDRRWEPDLVVAYDMSPETLASGRWRWFCGLRNWTAECKRGGARERELQDLSIEQLEDPDRCVLCNSEYELCQCRAKRVFSIC